MELSEIKSALINQSNIRKGDISLGKIKSCNLWYDRTDKQFKYTVVSIADNAEYHTLMADVEVSDAK